MVSMVYQSREESSLSSSQSNILSTTERKFFIRYECNNIGQPEVISGTRLITNDVFKWMLELLVCHKCHGKVSLKNTKIII